jgi:hypothetical protein
MQILRYNTPYEQFSESLCPRIFLAGPTVRIHQSHLLPSWRTIAIDEFENHKFSGTL